MLVFERVELTQTYNEFHGRRNAPSDLNNNLPENRSGPLFGYSFSTHRCFYILLILFLYEKHKHKMRFHTARV